MRRHFRLATCGCQNFQQIYNQQGLKKGRRYRKLTFFIELRMDLPQNTLLIF